jgi:putative hydrolase of the HAD superfamily
MEGSGEGIQHFIAADMMQSVLFDLDRTLLDRDTSFRKFVGSQYDKFQQALKHIPKDLYVAKVIALDNYGLVWKDKVYQTVTDELSISALTWQELFTDFDSRIAGYYVPFPDMHESLAELKQGGCSLGLVTNGKGEFQRRTIRALSLNNVFSTIVISEEVGLRKPDPEIFRRALRDLGCEPSRSAYIGDNPETDIVGARGAGMKTIWKRDSAVSSPPETDAIFENLAELPAIIRQLSHNEWTRSARTDPSTGSG